MIFWKIMSASVGNIIYILCISYVSFRLIILLLMNFEYIIKLQMCI